MPQIFRIGSYVIYIWSNEGQPVEPVHVLSDILELIELRADTICEKWKEHFGEIRFFC